MQINIVKNAKRNISFGVIYKIVQIICPFITRTLIQMILGAEYLGLSGLFTSIITVLSIAESGLEVAVVYNMYKPVAENDTATVCALLNFYRKMYRVIGLIILAIGLLITPFLTYLISGSSPDGINIRSLYLIYLSNAVIGYFMYAYMQSLIVVYQREDIRSKINIAVTLLTFIAHIVILLFTQNYYLYLLIIPAFTVLNNLWTAFSVHRMYPQYHCAGRLTNDMKDNIKIRISGAFLTNICNTTRNSFDSICLSTFSGLVVTGMYGNYYYIMYSIRSFVSLITRSIRGGIGNHVVTRSVDENYKELKNLDFCYMWIASWCTVCLLCLYQPFMRIWMGESMMFSSPVVILFCGYFYMLKMGDVKLQYMEANGLWWKQKNRAIVESVANLVLNIALGRFFGVYGIVSATMISLFFCNFLWGSEITFKQYFGLDKLNDYFKYQFKYLITTIIFCSLTYICCTLLPLNNPWLVLIARGFVCLILPNILWMLLYQHTEEFSYVLSILKRRDN